MMMLLVQDFLRQGGTLEQLITDHGVYSYHANGKVGFNYSQIEAKESDALACQCRGLILREETWEVVAYPFNRFFNHGSGHCAPINWETAAFEEKLDGTCVIGYHDDQQGEWRVATRKRPEANIETLLDGQFTFETLADEAAKFHGHENFQAMMSSADKNLTHVFELTSPINEVVVKYSDISFTLLGARNLNDFNELDPRPIAEKLGVPTPKLWQFSSLDDMIELVNSHHPHEHEGIVVKDHLFNRIKVKNFKHHLASGAMDTCGKSWRSTAEVIIKGYDDDLLPIVSSFVKDRLVRMRSGIDTLIQKTLIDYESIKHIDSMKDFAQEANKMAWPGALFALKRKKVADLNEAVKNCTAKGLVELVVAASPELGIKINDE